MQASAYKACDAPLRAGVVRKHQHFGGVWGTFLSVLEHELS